VRCTPSTLRDGADRRHPSGAADFVSPAGLTLHFATGARQGRLPSPGCCPPSVRLGLGSAWRGPPRCALVGALQNKESYELD
ncbi:MAG TPA: hypothetical protein PLN52_00050, partial [Opitutaceae bacterium]|nr:hypothetical protein [Opitutaceae bacterium]